MSDKATFHHVVDADGKAIDGFASPVPSTWFGTDLLPEGAKKATKSQAEGIEESQASADSDARIAELEAQVADLTKQLADATKSQGPSVPAKSSSREDLDAYATGTAGMTEDEVKAFTTKGDLHAELVKRAGSSS